MIVAEHTKTLPFHTFMFTNSLNSMYLLLNHIRNSSSHYNHPGKLLIIQIVNTLKIFHHNTTIRKVEAHTHIIGSDNVDKLAKQGANNPTL